MRPALSVGARIWIGVPVLIALLWATGLLASQGVGALEQVPAVTAWALPILRFCRDIAAIATVGTLAVGGLVVTGRSPRVLRWGSISALVWLLTLGLQFIATLSDVLVASPTESITTGAAWSLLSGTLLGEVFLWQFGAVALVAVCALLIRSRAAAWIVLLVAVAAAASPALLGHGGLSASHVAATASLAVHIGAVSIWVGGLLAVIAFLRLDSVSAATTLRRFSGLALVCVVIVAETGLLNASLRLSSPSQFISTWYGSLILAKAALLAALLRLGWLQRRRVLAAITPDTEVNAGLLTRFAALEFLTMGTALGVSVAMSRIGPSPAGTSTADFNPIAVTILALVLPALLIWSLPNGRGAAWLDRLRSHSEIPAVLLLIAIAEIAGAGLMNSLLGPEIGAIAGSLALAAVGWLFVTSVDRDGGLVGVVVAMVGWPLVAVFTSLMATNGLPTVWRGQLLATVLAEGVLVLLFLRVRSRTKAIANVPSASETFAESTS